MPAGSAEIWTHERMNGAAVLVERRRGGVPSVRMKWWQLRFRVSVGYLRKWGERAETEIAVPGWWNAEVGGSEEEEMLRNNNGHEAEQRKTGAVDKHKQMFLIEEAVVVSALAMGGAEEPKQIPFKVRWSYFPGRVVVKGEVEIPPYARVTVVPVLGEFNWGLSSDQWQNLDDDKVLDVAVKLRVMVGGDGDDGGQEDAGAGAAVVFT